MSDDSGTLRQIRKDRERQRIREDFLEAALAVFSRSGYHNATVEEIARQAGYSTGSLYNYFKNKQDMFTTLVRGVVERTKPQFDRVMDEAGTFHEGLDAYLQLMGDFATETLGGYRFLLDPDSHEGLASNELHEFMEESFWGMVERLSQLVVQGIEEGALRPQDPTVAAHALIGLATHFVKGLVLQREGQPQLTVELYVQLTRDYFLNGAAALSPDGGGT